MKTFSTFLTEGRDGPLYHMTSFTNAVSIIKRDTIFGRTDHIDAEKFIGKKTLGVSTTRSIRWAMDLFYDVSPSAIFELDSRVISHTNKIVPINIENVWDNLGYHPKWMTLFEEFVIGDIRSVGRAITKIRIDYDQALIDIDGTSHTNRQDQAALEELMTHPKLWDVRTKEFINR